MKCCDEQYIMDGFCAACGKFNQIDRMPRKGEKLIYKSKDTTTLYEVCGKFDNHKDILNIRNMETNNTTQIIVHFKEGWNSLLAFNK